MEVVTRIRRGLSGEEACKELQRIDVNHMGLAMKKVWDDISLYDDKDVTLMILGGTKIIVPHQARKEIMSLMHRGHPGQSRMKTRLRERYWWPAMSTEVINLVRSCTSCLALLPNKERVAHIMDAPTGMEDYDQPMDALATDLFYHEGTNYLVLADRFSSYPWVWKLRGQTTREVVKHLKECFETYGNPRILRSDGGPCYRSQEFKTFCDERGITLEFSSPYNAASNALAETTVKRFKHLMKKLVIDGDTRDLDSHISAMKNSPNRLGVTPNELFFKRTLRDTAPRLDNYFGPSCAMIDGRTSGRSRGSSHKTILDRNGGRSRESKMADRSEYLRSRRKNHLLQTRAKNSVSRTNTKFLPGDRILFKDGLSDREGWTKRGVIKHVCSSGQSYIIDSNDKEYRRNARFLRLNFSKENDKQKFEYDTYEKDKRNKKDEKNDEEKVMRRRSPRIHKKRVSFGDITYYK
jgi:transposase InsO family protein